MADWPELRHAYGSAEDVPGLLDQLGPDQRTQAWDDLWSRICHQGTVYSASYAALPALTQKAREWPACDRTGPLLLAAEVAELAALTGEALREPRLAADLVTYAHLLQHCSPLRTPEYGAGI
jgi:hypothetical protein